MIRVEVGPSVGPVVDDDVHDSVREDVPDHVITDGAIEVTYDTLGDLVTTMTERISTLEWDNMRLRRINMPTATCTGMTQDAINELIAKRVDEALKAYDAARNPKIEAEIKKEQQDDHVEGDVNNGNGNGNGNRNPNVNNRGVVGLTRWFEKMEKVFYTSNYPLRYQVKYASCTMMDNALTWWNSYKRTVRVDAAYTMTFQELTLLCTKMVPEEEDKVEKYIGSLPDKIQGNVIAGEPTRL
ncbi:hypothetical protein Tco_0179574 [Tanacetum coccineum]